MFTLFLNFVHDDRGAAGVEYGILVGAIAALMVVLVFALGSGVKAGFATVCDAMSPYVTMDACQ